MISHIMEYLNAGYPALWIKDWEVDRVVNELKRVQKGKTKTKKRIWSCTRGFVDPDTKKVFEKTADPYAALNFVESEYNGKEKIDEPCVYIFQNFHKKQWFEDFHIIQKIKELIPIAKGNERHLIFVSPIVKLPIELQKDITLLEFGLPNVEELDKVLDSVLISIGSKPAILDRDKLLQSTLGLTLAEAENAFALAYVKHKEFNHAAIETVQKLKAQFVNNTGILEFIPPKFQLEDIGGLNYLKEWALKRKNHFLPIASNFGLRPPKGVLVTGVPGCGKSLTAKALAAAWQMPLLRFDIGRIFGSLVGESEEQMRMALKTAEAISPCILWFDEIEKMFAGVGGGNNGDSGVTQRVFGFFLTWMQEKEHPVFLFATANNIEAMPPEFTRKGRFDEVFFVDLPNDDERKAIVEIHLTKRKKKPDYFDLPELVRESQGYSGAEIEEAIESALSNAFDQDMRELTTEDIVQAFNESIPLSTSRKEQIENLRKWAEERARNASGQQVLVPIPDTVSGNRVIHS
ncbi:AAA family ATPase [Brevibacillus sp. AG]|uniref:AAA family ATPase n=1 Tax=Brevibacillus sp. AG TaxID=3020891 RepID=UPI00232A92CE|nr:AAA family ATPase [Brevibacillus sp. AG]MDC0764137.1 AAA family ATPase [Brevibacillus sp. AG]